MRHGAKSLANLPDKGHARQSRVGQTILPDAVSQSSCDRDPAIAAASVPEGSFENSPTIHPRVMGS